MTQALPIGFYPLALNALVDEIVCHELADADEFIYEEMGAYSADCFSREVYSSYFDQETAAGFLQQSCDLYHRYYQNAGKRFLHRVGPGAAELWLTASAAPAVPDRPGHPGAPVRGATLRA